MKYIDISQWQGEPDFEQVMTVVDGVIIRAGYGQGTIDKRFERNISECNRLGIPCGVYWFSYAASPEQARKEAEYCLAAIAPYDIQLPVAFDFEYDSVEAVEAKGVAVTRSLATSLVHAFCETVAQAGYTAMNYTNPDFLARYFDETTLKYELWLAEWPGYVPNDNSRPSRECGIWQWGVSRIPGIKGDVDTNIAFTDYAEEDEEMSYEKFKEYMAKYEAEKRELPADAYAEQACMKGVASGIFSDGNGDGMIDYPQAYVKRQELAAVMDRKGLLD